MDRQRKALVMAIRHCHPRPPSKRSAVPLRRYAMFKARLKHDGMVKVLPHATTDEILGVHILGPDARSLINEAVVGHDVPGECWRTSHAPLMPTRACPCQPSPVPLGAYLGGRSGRWVRQQGQERPEEQAWSALALRVQPPPGCQNIEPPSIPPRLRRAQTLAATRA